MMQLVEPVQEGAEVPRETTAEREEENNLPEDGGVEEQDPG